MILTELKIFIQKNSPLIYEYINNEVLKEIGKINPNYFVKLLNDMFSKQMNTRVNLDNLTPNVLPYFIFTQIESKGRMDYTSLRTETLNLNQLNDEAKVYYNYARFSLKEGFFIIDLMQTKIGGMPIDEDIVKYSKQISIKKQGLEEFIIRKDQDIVLHKDLVKIKEEVKKI